MRRPRRQSDNNLSFLDVISCGFGAIVLLILITKTTVGVPIEDFLHEVEQLKEQLALRVAARAEDSEAEQAARVRVADERERVQAAQQALSTVQEAQASRSAQAAIAEQLKAALQTLNAEMRKLDLKPSAPDVIGGVPADSEYIIFIVDTSGSMKQFAWRAVERQLVAILDAYPKVRGLQVMNDMGRYMFSGYRGRWIPDTASRRKIVIKQFRDWEAYSNSSPVEGIIEAIKTFGRKSKKISLYILGDEYTGQSIQGVIDRVDQLNHRQGRRQVRIHAIGFFTRTQIERAAPAYADTTARFARLMRELTRRNGGTFIGEEAN